MARPGETIENPVTGERITFRETGEGSDGSGLLFDYVLEPAGFAVGRLDHVHPRQEERFEVKSGRLGVRIDGDEWTATEGTRFAILPRTPHTVWNDGSEKMHAVVEMRPALDVESFFETMYRLARDGKTNESGIPSPLRFATIAAEFDDEIRITGVSGRLQTILTTALARIGRLRGYRARPPRYSE